jgi:hypothetical protein
LTKAIDLVGKTIHLVEQNLLVKLKIMRPLPWKSYLLVGVLLNDGLTAHTFPVDLRPEQGHGKVAVASQRNWRVVRDVYNDKKADVKLTLSACCASL